MKLTANVRTTNKKSETKQIRREGKIPAVPYSAGQANQQIIIDTAEFQAPFVFLPGTESPPLGVSHFLKNVDGLELYLGMSEGAAKQIVEYMKNPDDAALLKFTSDASRFASKETLARWYSDISRYVFTLMDSQERLAGLWFARKSTPPRFVTVTDPELKRQLDARTDSLHTGGVRIYPLFRGK